MMKKLISVSLALAMALGLTACQGGSSASTSSSAQPQSDVAYIQEKGTLVVGITPFAPMDFQNEQGEWVGFDADMAREVGEALGVEVEFSVIDWKNKLLELDSKTVDCLWNGMTVTEEITNGASATNPYAKNAQVVVVRSEVADQYQTEESISQLNFAVEEGSAGAKVAAEKGWSTTTVTKQADALLEVASGTSDACIVDLLMAGAMIGDGTSYENLTKTISLTEEDYAVGCRKGSDLTDFINEQLQILEENGTTQKLAEKYGVVDNLISQG